MRTIYEYVEFQGWYYVINLKTGFTVFATNSAIEAKAKIKELDND